MSGKVLIVGGSVVREYDSTAQPRLLTTTITQAEIATLEGDRYSAQADFTLANGGIQYLQFTMPSILSQKVSGFIFRDIKSSDGIDFDLFWEPTGMVKGNSIPIFNENQLSPKNPQTEYTLVTSVTTEGVIRESNFSIPGQGNRGLSGEINPATGYRVYAPDSVALLKIENTSSSTNRVLITYSWVESPISLGGE